MPVFIVVSEEEEKHKHTYNFLLERDKETLYFSSYLKKSIYIYLYIMYTTITFSRLPEGAIFFLYLYSTYFQHDIYVYT